MIALIGGILFCFFIGSLYISGIILSILLIFAIAELLFYINRTNRDINSFLTAIKYQDFTTRYNDKGHEKRYSELRRTFNSITNEFQNLKKKQEFHHHLLQNILTQIPIGIMVIQNQEKIILYNEEAKKICGIEHLISLLQLQKLAPEFYSELMTLKEGYSDLFHFKHLEESSSVSVKKTEIKSGEDIFWIVTLQNLTVELENRELESWQKLMRVLTHEIMNSITPIVSLSQIMEEELNENYPEISDDIKLSIGAIKNRSENLKLFVERYRKIARIQKPEVREIDLKIITEKILQIVYPLLKEKNISLVNNIKKSIFVLCDESHIEQILINLLKNAIEAVENIKGKIIIDCTFFNNSISYSITDNGVGILKENYDKIFIPFFSTKENGSGIGLSLSRQMLIMNNASMSFQSEVGEGTKMILHFQAK